MDGFKSLLAWQVAMELAEAVYRVSTQMPKEETYGLRSQIRNAAASVAGNIAEGYGRNNRKEYVHFLGIALGSLYEVETFYLLALRLGQVSSDEGLEGLLVRESQLLSKLRKSLRPSKEVE